MTEGFYLIVQEWSHDELQLLIKAVNLFPAGTTQRWEVCAEFINQHTKTQVDDQPVRQNTGRWETSSPLNTGRGSTSTPNTGRWSTSTLNTGRWSLINHYTRWPKRTWTLLNGKSTTFDLNILFRTLNGILRRPWLRLRICRVRTLPWVH